MTPENFERTIGELHARSPFRPFTVVLNSGRQFEVDHPGALVHRGGVAVFISPGGAPIIFDHEGVEHFVADLAEKADDED
jgi:hypothetical protein